MKRWKLIMPIMLLPSLLLAGGIWVQNQAYEKPVLTMSMPAGEQAAASDSYSSVTPTAAAIAKLTPPTPPLLLASVNGILLSDDLSKILEVKGEPLSIVQDEIVKASQTYLYKDCEINMTDGIIQSIVVPAVVGKVIIDGVIIPFDQLKEKLGTPFFVSEDGLVYRVGNHAFKIFGDESEGSIHYISFFHVAAQ
jgi:hypothetical protein